MEKIRIDIGVYTALTVDLTEFDFTDVQKVVMTVKNYPPTASPIIEREYTEAKVYNEIITPQESKMLKVGAVYDFTQVMQDGKRFKVGDNGSVEVVKGCGQCELA